MSPTPESRPVRFLLVEDDLDHAYVVRRTIEKERIRNEIAHATDGAMAMRMLRKEGEHANQPRPDIILLDLKMPVMDGHEVLAEIKKDPHLRTIPVVIMTTSNAESDRERAYEHQANSYVVKPLEFDRFRQLVKDLALYWSMWNEPAPGSE